MPKRVYLFLIILLAVAGLKIIKTEFPGDIFLYLFVAGGITLLFPWFLMLLWRMKAQDTLAQVMNPPPLSQKEWRRLLTMVYRLSRTAQIRPPKLEILNDRELPRANSYAFWPQRGVIQISWALVEQWNWKSIEGVLAHEIAHLVHKDSWLSLWRVSLMIFFLSFTVMLAPHLVYFVLLTSMVWELMKTREREYLADDRAARIASEDHVLHYLVDGCAHQERKQILKKQAVDKISAREIIKKLNAWSGWLSYRFALWAVSFFGISAGLKARLFQRLQNQYPQHSERDLQLLIRKLIYLRATQGSTKSIIWPRNFNKK